MRFRNLHLKARFRHFVCRQKQNKTKKSQFKVKFSRKWNILLQFSTNILSLSHRKMNIYRILWVFNVLQNKMRSHNNANQMMMTKTPEKSEIKNYNN